MKLEDLTFTPEEQKVLESLTSVENEIEDMRDRVFRKAYQRLERSPKRLR